MPATKDGITDLIAEYLRDNAVQAVTQISIPTPGSRSQPDYQIKNNGSTFLGEAKWEKNKWQGFAEVRDYGQLIGTDGTFLIRYPEALKQEGAQARLDSSVESILSGHTYTYAFL